MTELTAYFGQVVRRSRDARGWSQEALAEKADLNRSYVGEIERGQVIPSLHTMEKLAAALGVSASELLATCERLRADTLNGDNNTQLLASIAC
jgi:XRE family transcriptional regulator, regulator of sulfur utilization